MKYLTVTIEYSEDSEIPKLDFAGKTLNGKLLEAHYSGGDYDDEDPDLFEAMGLKPVIFDS